MRRMVIVPFFLGLVLLSAQAEPIDAVSAASYLPPPIPRDQQQTIEAVESWLDSHWLMNIATTEPDGSPNISGAVYEADGLSLFFVTKKASNKYRNIGNNPRVAVSIWDPVETMRQLKVVEIAGKATVLEGEERDIRSKAFDGYPFPESYAVIRIDPEIARWTDREQVPAYTRIVNLAARPESPE